MNINPPTGKAVARTILDGFDRHYFLFRRYGYEAKFCFEHADWSRAEEGRKERILGYEARVNETVNILFEYVIVCSKLMSIHLICNVIKMRSTFNRLMCVYIRYKTKNKA